MQHLHDKTAFVTGGASGMGLAMARSLGRAGMRVAVADVEWPALEAAAADLGTEGFDVWPVRVDVSDRAAMEQAAEATVARFGKVHVLCNNAGVSVAGPVDRMQYADWDWVLGVNLWGVINGLHAFLPHLKRHGEGGHVVNTSSISGLVPEGGVSVYVCSKFAVVGLSESIRQELAPYGIGVTVLCPHAVATNIVKSGRNRPESLQRRRRGGTPSAEAVAMQQMIEAAVAATFADAMDPALIGDMVVDAIHHDDAYIFSHPEDRAAVAARHAALMASFDRWERYRVGRNS